MLNQIRAKRKVVRVLLEDPLVFPPFWQHDNDVSDFEYFRGRLSLGRIRSTEPMSGVVL